MRLSLVANFGSVASDSSPRARLKRVYWSGFMMTTWTQPSLVRNASAGVRYGFRLPTRGGRLRVEIVSDGIGQQRERGGQQAHVEVLALPRAESMGQRGVRDAEGEERRGDIGDGAADLRGRVPGHAREGHDAAHALGDGVVPRSPGMRPGLTEARHRDVDGRRVHGTHGGV